MGRKCVDYGEECSGGRREEKREGEGEERTGVTTRSANHVRGQRALTGQRREGRIDRQFEVQLRVKRKMVLRDRNQPQAIRLWTEYEY